MRKFFVQEEMQLIESKAEKVVEYLIDIPEIYGFDYMQKIDKEFIELFDSIGDYKKPILFKIVGEFELLDVADAEDRVSFIIGLISIFVGNMIKKGTSTGRGRFAAPASLDKFNVSAMVKRDLVNREIRYPIFALDIVNKNDESVYEVM